MSNHHQPPRSAEDWEQIYAQRPQRWSGGANRALTQVVDGLAPGRVLDLGAGEGADAVWLAQHGWDVVAAEWSALALQRLTVLAERAGVAERIHASRIDLTRELPEGSFDLIVACFFLWGDDAARNATLRRLSALVRSGGRLLVVDHGSAPPWSPLHGTQFATPEDTYTDLALGANWSPERLASAQRATSGPSGQSATILDNIIVARRSKPHR